MRRGTPRERNKPTRNVSVRTLPGKQGEPSPEGLSTILRRVVITRPVLDPDYGASNRTCAKRDKPAVNSACLPGRALSRFRLAQQTMIASRLRPPPRAPTTDMPDFRKQLLLFDDYREMLSDSVRMEAYAQAIAATVKPGDQVVDLGAGTGILSLMAARAGAQMVHAIEHSDAIELARRVAQANGLAERITFYRAMSTEIELPHKCDVLLSETLGSFGLEENTLEFTIDARKRFLLPDARMLPCELESWVAPVEHPAQREKAAFWDSVGGFDFSAARHESQKRMSVADIAPQQVLSPPQRFAKHDLRTQQETEAAARLLFRVSRPAAIDGFAGWFRVQLAADIGFATSPWDPATHWRQAFFPLDRPVEVIEGDFFELTLRIGARADHSDNSTVSYDYRCTQLANEQA